MRNTLTFLTASGLLGLTQAASSPASSPGYLKLDAIRYTGQSQSEMVPFEPRFLVKRDSDGVVVPMVNGQIFYGTTIQLGSNHQRVAVMLDSGSSDLWVIGSDNPGCESGTTGQLSQDEQPESQTYAVTLAATDSGEASPTLEATDSYETDYGYGTDYYGTGTYAGEEPQATSIDCAEYGTFNPDSSDSFESNGTDFSITYGDGTYANGTWAHDTLVINGVEVPNMSFAIANDTDNDMGVFGIGYRNLESTEALATHQGYTYDNFPQRLQRLGLTNSSSYAVFLNGTDSKRASILFGAIDEDKYVGDLTLFPIVPEDGVYQEIRILLTGVSVGSNVHRRESVVGSGSTPALLDTGTTAMYLPADIVARLIEEFNMQSDSSGQMYYTACNNSAEYFVTFDFQGTQIRAPLEDFLAPIVESSGSPTGYCMFTINAAQDGEVILGDSFLRNVYFVADLDNNEVALGVANLDSSRESIRAISNGIPSASSVSDWSTSYESGVDSLTSVRASPSSMSESLTLWATGTASSQSSSQSSSHSSSAASSASHSSASATSTSSSSTHNSGASTSFSSYIPHFAVLLAGATVALMM